MSSNIQENPSNAHQPVSSVQQPPLLPQKPGKARLQCHACQRLLEYDAGAQYVQCFSCSTMNAVQPSTQMGGQVLSMLCAICHTTNLAPYGINYVRCGSCQTISQVSHAYRQDRMIAPNSQSIQQPSPPKQVAPVQRNSLNTETYQGEMTMNSPIQPSGETNPNYTYNTPNSSDPNYPSANTSAPLNVSSYAEPQQ